MNLNSNNIYNYYIIHNKIKGESIALKIEVLSKNSQKHIQLVANFLKQYNTNESDL